MKVEGSDGPISRHPPELDDGDFAVDDKGVAPVPSSSVSTAAPAGGPVPNKHDDGGGVANGLQQPVSTVGNNNNDGDGSPSFGGHNGPSSVDSGLGLGGGGGGGGNGNFMFNVPSASGGMILPDVNVFHNGNLFQVSLLYYHKVSFFLS